MPRFTLLVLTLLPVFTGCASIVSGQNQPLSVETRLKGSPISGASCTMLNDKGQWFVTTPGTVTVQRSYNDLSVSCDAAGAAKGITMVKSATKPMAFGNLLFGGVIGVGVDVATGAAYDYPTLITVEMGEHTTIALPAPPTAVTTNPVR